MKTTIRKLISVATIGVIAAFASITAQATLVITWDASATAINYSDPTQVSTAGTFIDSFSNHGTISHVVNGVTFNNYTGPTISSGTGSNNFLGAFANGSGITINYGTNTELYLPYGNGGIQGGIPSGAYGDLVRGNAAGYATVVADPGAYIELTNLTLGNTYLIQLWNAPWDNNFPIRYSGSSDFSVGVSPKVESFVSGPGTAQFINGSFTADATTQNVYFRASNNAGDAFQAGPAVLAAGQLRDTTPAVPEPSTMLLISAGGLLIWRRRAQLHGCPRTAHGPARQ